MSNALWFWSDYPNVDQYGNWAVDPDNMTRITIPSSLEVWCLLLP